MQSISQRIADELKVPESRTAAAIKLLDEGSTVPFIARYRKEATGGLDDAQLRTIEERLSYLREMEERRRTILASITEQGKMTPEIETAIKDAATKTALEDLYLPFKPKRRTRAVIAREAGLEPLADLLLADPALVPEEAAAPFVDAEKSVADVRAALDGARHILIERFGEDAALIGRLRDMLADKGKLISRVVEARRADGAKFTDYFDFQEEWRKVPSHRALAMFRGRSQGILSLRVDVDAVEGQPHPADGVIAAHLGIKNEGRPGDAWLIDTVRLTWKTKIGPHIETDLLTTLRERSEEEAIRVFAHNLHDLLLAAPAGERVVLGLDPGIRTGVKVAVVDATGKLLDATTIYPHQPKNDREGSLATLAELVAKHSVDLIAVGNGTAGRETDKLVAELIKAHPEFTLTRVMVSEAGASVYSASETGSKEFPDLDVTLRGAVSIARRLQDPLAELVKIEPRSIGVGQYQHDVPGGKLSRSLDAVVEDCVNAVGVDVNTASIPLLARVSGLSDSVAKAIVEFRDANGPFPNRARLVDVPRMGPKTFEQAAGFLRVQGGDTPLDGSAVHPEAYPLVERILEKTGRELTGLIGDAAFLRSLEPEDFVDERFGVPTVTDILRELEKPGRDPRPDFKTAAFMDGIDELKDLQPGMELEGVVTNVTAFGAFVDIGVHQDGLVHISQLSHTFVKDPHSVVKAGDVVRVKVLEIDLDRKRAALTMKLGEPPAREAPARHRPHRRPERPAQTDAAAPVVAAGEVPKPRNEPRPPRPPRDDNRGPRNENGPREPRPPRDDRGPKPNRDASAPPPRPAKQEPPPSGIFAEAFARALASKKK